MVLGIWRWLPVVLSSPAERVHSRWGMQADNGSTHSSNVTMATMPSANDLLLEVFGTQSMFSDGPTQVLMPSGGRHEVM